MDGTSSPIRATSMHNCKFKFILEKVCKIISRILKITQLSRTVDTMSVTYVAVVTLRLRLKAKNRYVARTENKICSNADLNISVGYLTALG
jgi:hypothetical protein